MVTRRAGRRRPSGLLRALLLPLAVLGALVTGTVAPAAAASPDRLYLVTLDGPGLAGYRGPATTPTQRQRLLAAQDAVLEDVDAAAPLYRWTTALNGFAVALSPAEAERLSRDPRVALVEANAVRPLAGSAHRSTGGSAPGAARGGAGTVTGVIDTGIWPESSLFASVPGLGRQPDHFRGGCEVGPEWDADTCNAKLVAAHWFVDGFGSDRVRTTSSLSPRDDSGHGTEVASIAAGNSGVSVSVAGLRLPAYAGVASQARIAVYKACWTAPDPADDGCATADLVAAIDRATRDGVDVINLSVGGPAELDTVERALLGAAERDIVVVAAAGNTSSRSYAAHASPWVTTVGGVSGDQRRGRLAVTGGPTLAGAMASTRRVGPTALVVGSDVSAPGASRRDARICAPGSLDASRTVGAVVLCERGAVARVVKSETVRLADGVAMVLANVRPGPVDADLHVLPTVHLDEASARSLLSWHARHPRARVSLRPLGLQHRPARVTPWSSTGDPTAILVKPDVVGPAVGVLGAVPPAVRSTRWDFASGTSAATAVTSGLALRLRSRHPRWSADEVRSALATTAASVLAPSVLHQGAGLPVAARADHPALAYLVRSGDYRAWLDGSPRRGDLNVPSILLTGDTASTSRTITNVGGRTRTVSARVKGLTRHQVTVTPAVVTLAPGESASYVVRVSGPSGATPLDDGWLSWVGGGSQTRIPVALGR